VAGKAQVTDPPRALLLFEVIQNIPFGIGIDAEGILADVVKQVEIKMYLLQVLQLISNLIMLQ
jgi:hypothetical protein